MRITWYGLACFRIAGEDVTIVTDPYEAPTFGFEPMAEPADIVIRSSPDDIAHSARTTVPGDHALVEAVEVARSGPTSVLGITFEAFRTRERLAPQKPEPGENAMYRFAVDGVRILHLGDIGIPFLPDHIDQLRDQVDIMLAVTGDNYTIALDDLVWGIGQIRPKVVIPMHYQVDRLRLPRGFWMFPLQAFASRYPSEIVDRDGTSSATYVRDHLPVDLRIRVLEAAG